MAVSPVGGPGTTSPSASNQTVEADKPVESSAKRQQRAILEANRSVSLSVGNESLSLVYQAAIDAINEELAPELGPQALERGVQEGLDVSPEATAERIVSLTTGLFALYQQQRPELTSDEQLDRFLEVIGGGIDQGFEEAREILDGLGVLEGSIAENIDRTYALVQEGLAAFRERISGEGAEEASGAADQAPGT